MTRIMSFGFRYGGPNKMQDDGLEIIDVRRFKNPYHDRALRQLNGLHQAVRTEVLGTSGVDNEVARQVARLRTDPMARVAFGCTAGRHRSVAIAEEVARQLGEQAHHRDQTKWPK